MRHSRSLLVAVGAVAFATVIAGCSGGPADDSGPTAIRIGVVNTPVSANNPFTGGSIIYGGNGSVTRTSYESFVQVDPETSEYVPLLASEFEVSEDRKSVAITLRDDVDFTDGTHLDAAAVADYFDLLLNNEQYLASAAPLARWGLTVEATGEYTLEVTTSLTIDDGFMDDFMEGSIIASPVAAEDPDALSVAPVGTGPYLLDELVEDVSASYVRNPDYRDPEAYDFDTVEVLRFEDEIAASNALKGDQVDAILVGGSSFLPELEAEGFKIASSGGTYRGFVIFDFDGRLVPALGDVRVRQAIMMAFDQEAMAEQIEQGYATVGDQPFSPKTPQYVDGGDDRYPYDVEGAKELLAEAGYADGFEVKLPAANVGFYPKDFEPIIQQSLADIGITATFEQLADVTALIGAWTGGQYPIITSNLAYSYTTTLFQGEVPSLGGHFDADPTFHRLTTIMNEGTQEEYDAAADELGEYILEQAWFLPLSHISASRVVYNPEIVDVKLAQDRFSTGLSDFHLPE